MGSIIDVVNIFHVEDESAIVWYVEDMLADMMNCNFISSQRVNEGLVLLGKNKFDLAILDINIAGVPVYPIAERLDVLDVPFFFLSGYGSAGVLSPWRDRLVLQKPCSRSELIFAVRNTLNRRVIDS